MSRQIGTAPLLLDFSKEIDYIKNGFNLRAVFLSPRFQEMEFGRQGTVGNGHASRVWKGDGAAIIDG